MPEESNKIADCQFCRWIAGGQEKPPALLDNDRVIATLCESPIARGHTQVTFKTHYSELAEVSPEDASALGLVIPPLARAIKIGLEAEMVYVACISEEVRHVHFHLVPRYRYNTKGFQHFTGNRIELTEVDEIVASIKAHLGT